MTRRPPPARVVVDRVVVHGVPAAGLDPAAVSAAVHESVPALLAQRMRGQLVAGRRRVAVHRASWSPAGGTDAVSRAVAGGVAEAIEGRHD